jgi:hypothetical protein
MRSHLILALVALVSAPSCLVPSVDLSGKACDTGHPCPSGLLCVDRVCVSASSDAGVDAGSDGGEPECTGNELKCVGNERYACEGGHLTLIEDCRINQRTCNERYGCVTSCAGGAECPSGEACNQSTELCIRQPVCSGDGGCTGDETCSSGACLPASAAATVTMSDGGTAEADLSCYPPPAPGDAGPSVTVRGRLVSAAGEPTSRTIGYSLSLYLADQFLIGGEPLTQVVVGSDTGTGGVGSFELTSVPTDTDLVAASDGDAGLPTYQFFRVPQGLAVSGIVSRFDLVSHEESLWETLGASAGAEMAAESAGIDGQIFDCRNPSRRVAGATAALDVEAQASYTLPGFVAVDTNAHATANNGRFFFFDVPAMSLGLIVGLGPELAIHRSIRTVKGGVTVVSIVPADR